jgi:hypothetical protein
MVVIIGLQTLAFEEPRQEEVLPLAVIRVNLLI